MPPKKRGTERNAINDDVAVPVAKPRIRIRAGAKTSSTWTKGRAVAAAVTLAGGTAAVLSVLSLAATAPTAADTRKIVTRLQAAAAAPTESQTVQIVDKIRQTASAARSSSSAAGVVKPSSLVKAWTSPLTKADADVAVQVSEKMHSGLSMGVALVSVLGAFFFLNDDATAPGVRRRPYSGNAQAPSAARSALGSGMKVALDAGRALKGGVLEQRLVHHKHTYESQEGYDSMFKAAFGLAVGSGTSLWKAAEHVKGLIAGDNAFSAGKWLRFTTMIDAIKAEPSLVWDTFKATFKPN